MKKIFTLLSVVALGISANAQVVINEVYGGGGASTSVYINDFVELINIGNTSVTLSDVSIQYASATGLCPFQRAICLTFGLNITE